ncbi:exopolyphosphatase [Rhodoferax sp.]|uniref:Ppx/GppA phosphatase family protein n=1 Tax=Rhodoferax sp. TaxID=50421 RepID=UPI00374CC8E7
MQDGTRLAAVDLGSNSFRLEIGRIEHGQFFRTEYLKETVRQGNGLDLDRNLTPEAMQRGWDCLARFGERLAGFSATEVRAVATQTLREARNRDQFLTPANQLLGFPIDVISGREEARLIYQGVAQALPHGDERRLVVDVGGRSTELILGQGFEPSQMESYRVGSVAWSTRYFADNQFTQHAFDMAEIAAKAVLDEALSVYRRDTWDVAYGSAGTVNAVADVLAAAGWPSGYVSRAGLDWLQDKLISAQSADRIRLIGMREDRRTIIGGGLSVLRAVFDLLQIDQMQQATGGLRHGLLFDLMGARQDQSDVRARSVQRLAAKFGSNTAHGVRVGRVATHLLTQLQGSALSPQNPAADPTQERLHRKLEWAAQLHDIGSHISHSDYHKHGAYILDNADAMGFTLPELHKLSLLVLGHRGKLRKLDVNFEDELFVQQLLCLRLAVILCHARRDPDLDGLTLTRANHANSFSLDWRVGWAQAFPQSAHLLREEVLAWQKTPWSLTLGES